MISEIFALVWLVLKYPLLALLIYFLYSFIYKPYRVVLHFRKFSTQCEVGTFIPMAGDLLKISKYEKEGKYPLNFIIDEAGLIPNKSASLVLFGNDPVLSVHNLEA